MDTRSATSTDEAVLGTTCPERVSVMIDPPFPKKISEVEAYAKRFDLIPRHDKTEDGYYVVCYPLGGRLNDLPLQPTRAAAIRAAEPHLLAILMSCLTTGERMPHPSDRPPRPF